MEIARPGCRTVEGHPEDVAGRWVSNSFLRNATLSRFERERFPANPPHREESLGRGLSRPNSEPDEFAVSLQPRSHPFVRGAHA